jgi:L-threonylcarbamoyladenylate synthase
VRRKPDVVQVDRLGNPKEAVLRAALVVKSGGIVAFPTESFYGLAVDVNREAAIERLFVVKKRRRDRPVLILISSLEAVDRFAARVPSLAKRLMKAFWPGGLTLILETAADVSPLLTAGTGKIGMRLSSHPVATTLANAVGGAVTGTSANRSGEPPCRNPRAILETLGAEVDLILDGGETPGETGSTVMDVTVSPPRIVREGLIPFRQLEAFF